MNDDKSAKCHICGRVLDFPADPRSIDCGGDCWGCVGDAEATLGDHEALARVRNEFEQGLRPEWTDPFNQ